MNKKDVSEIKKHLVADDDHLVLNRVLTTIVDADGQVKYETLRSFTELTDRELGLYYQTLRPILTGKLNKKFTEYRFTNTEYNDESPQGILYNCVRDRLYSKDQFIEQITNNLGADVQYAIIAAHFTYTVFRKNKMDEEDDFNEYSFEFILTAICPIASADTGFAFSFTSEEFSSEADRKLYISKDPTEGFMFPAFTNRESDINSVMYYCKDADAPNSYFIEHGLGASFVMSAEQELTAWNSVLEDTLGEGIDYNTLSNINTSICAIMDSYKNDNDLSVIDARSAANVLLNCDVAKERLSALDNSYKDHCGDASLHLSNIAHTSTKIEGDGFSISIKDMSVPVTVTKENDTYKITIEAGANIDINGIQI